MGLAHASRGRTLAILRQTFLNPKELATHARGALARPVAIFCSLTLQLPALQQEVEHLEWGKDVHCRRRGRFPLGSGCHPDQRTLVRNPNTHLLLFTPASRACPLVSCSRVRLPAPVDSLCTVDHPQSVRSLMTPSLPHHALCCRVLQLLAGTLQGSPFAG